MTTTINASTSAGLVQTADTSGILQLQTASTAALTIDASQKVGIGTTSPAGRLDITSNSPTTGNFSARIVDSGSYGCRLSMQSTATNGLIYQIGSNFNTGIGEWATVDATNSQTVDFYAPSSSGYRALYTNGTERMRITSAGNVGIGTTSPTSQNGKVLQIDGGAGAADFRLTNTATGTAKDNGILLGLSGSDAYLYNFENAFMAFGTNATERMRINSDGSVMIGTTTNFGNGGFLDVDSTAAVVNGVNVKCNNVNYAYIAYTGTNFMYFTTSGTSPVGTITYNGSITVYGTTSDQRLKENIVDAPSAFDFINSLKIRSFDWKESGKHHKFGVIAQELVEVSEECVSVPQKEEDIWQVDTSPLIPALAKAIQELKAINDTQAETINALTARIVALEAK